MCAVIFPSVSADRIMFEYLAQVKNQYIYELLTEQSSNCHVTKTYLSSGSGIYPFLNVNWIFQWLDLQRRTMSFSLKHFAQFNVLHCKTTHISNIK